MTRRSLLFLSLLFLAIPAFSQTGDLSVSIDADQHIAGVGFFGYVVHVSWAGSTEPAQNVVLDMNLPGELVATHPYTEGLTCTQTNPLRCTIAQLAPGTFYDGMFVQVRLPGPGTYTATLTGSTSTPESSLSNNTATHTVVVAGLPDLDISTVGEPDVALDPGEEGTLRVGVTNRGETANNVVFRVSVPDGGAITVATADEYFPTDTPTRCSVEDGVAICRRDVLEAGGFTLAHIRYRAPQHPNGGKVVVVATVDADQDDFNPTNDTTRHEVDLRRFLTVTSAADDGSGTLRQAILDANAQCATSPCTISLAGIGVVQPARALPQITGITRIDGGTARATLDGSRLAEGNDGLVMDGACSYEVRNLVIRNVPHHAIEVRQTPERANQCGYSLLGYDTALVISKTEISGSERGIVTKNFDGTFTENVIHENRRSGMFLDGTWYSVLRNNVIVNNGASGVFVNNSTVARFGIPAGTELIENVIHGNAEFGIARTRNGLVQMTRNSLVRNGVFAYDIDLDLASPNRENDTTGVPNKPVLISATYDPVSGKTIVRGVAQSSTGFSLDFYASDSRDARGGPQAERWLLSTILGVTRPNFEVALPGDLRGQWITATLTNSRTLYFLRTATPATQLNRPSSGSDTSELSEALQAQ